MLSPLARFATIPSSSVAVASSSAEAQVAMSPAPTRYHALGAAAVAVCTEPPAGGGLSAAPPGPAGCGAAGEFGPAAPGPEPSEHAVATSRAASARSRAAPARADVDRPGWAGLDI